ncbi:MMPL family transporter [Micromonospora sp. NBC_00898]|uniref:MMPL family transporter n=1 Tax=Micromonospora sp. NBC_00898 TaxID=2975981 RepID=UPI003869D595|nr:MMPL family transporter [Micromonospora sp. NBC_00898]
MYRLLTLPSGRRAKWVVLACWLAALFVATPLAGKLFSAAEDSTASFLPRNAESTRVAQARQAFPGGDASPVVVVYQRVGGLTAADRDRVGADAQMLRQRYAPSAEPFVPVPAHDGTALLYQVPISTTGAQDAGTVIINAVKDIRHTVGGDIGELTVKVTGPAGFTADSVEVFDDLELTLLLIPLAVVAVLLLLIYRSPVLFLVPLFCVVVANQVSSALVYGLAAGPGLRLNSMAATVLGILVYGAGTDYALLIIARYREELRRHADRHDAMREALRCSGPAVLASAGTVAAGLLCLLAANLNSTSALGPVGALAALGAVLAMLTLLPALLVILGRWVFWPFVPRPVGQGTEPGGRGWRDVGAAIGRRPRVTWVITVAVIGACAFGLTGFSTPQRTLFADPPDSVQGQQLIAAHYPAGAGHPLEIVARAGYADAVRDAARGTAGVTDVQPAGRTADLVAFQATPSAAPSSDAEYDTVTRLRDRLHAVEGADAHVGGPGAMELDLNVTNTRDATVVIPLVLFAILAILCLLLRALVAPLLLVATVILSFAAALGLSVVVFEDVLGWHGQEASLPILAFVFLVALGVDYNIFLISRVREEAARLGTRQGTLRGLAVTGGVITSAGIILAATFAVLATLPVLNVAQLGFVVSLGILLDTFIVRSILVPALTIDVGRLTWWPSRLARAVPGSQAAAGPSLARAASSAAPDRLH